MLRLPWSTDIELQEDEWERPPPRPESGVLALRLAPPRVSWTYEAPSVPGLYFVKLPPNGPCRVVDVYRQGTVVMAEWSDIRPFPVQRSGMLWSDHRLLEPV